MTALARRDDPIVAVATAGGRGAIGIVRLSGPGLDRFARALTGRAADARQAAFASFRDASGRAIDRGLVLFFPGPRSYTGEDVLELQAHGGPVVLQMLVERCLELAASLDATTGAPLLPSLRLARPGEFTERAFLAGKLDLAQAEAVADLIDAGSAQAARSAARSLDGDFSREIGALVEATVELRALVEATLDFPDEEIEFLERYGALGRLDAITARLDRALAAARQGALLQAGIRVVLAGQPNVGKSSLLNALAGLELAIVTDVAGTTRDRIGQTIAIEGVPVHVVDTAGLRDEAPADAIEKIGIERSWQAIGEADVVVFVRDLTRTGEAGYDAGDREIEAALRERGAAVLEVLNKADRRVGRRHTGVAAASARTGGAAPSSAVPGGSVPTSRDVPERRTPIEISAITGEGLDTLRAALLERAGWRPEGEGVFAARARHLDALRRARSALVDARAHAAEGDGSLELMAEALRAAHDALGEITGAVSADDLLGAIFSRFCIGK